MTHNGPFSEKDTGAFSKDLLKEVLYRIKPKYHLFGHFEKPGITYI